MQQAQAQLQETREQILQQESKSKPFGSDPELQQKLDQAKTTRKEVEHRTEEIEARSKKIEDQLQLPKIEVGKWLEAKDNLNQQLCQQLIQHQETTQLYADQIKELEEYVKI